MATRDASAAVAAAPADRRRAWVVFTVVVLAATTAPFNQYKVPPLIPVLIDELHLSHVEAGLLMSVFSVTGMVLALPAGVLFRRFGPRRTGIFSVGCTALGSLLGAAAPNGQWLLATRLVEGVGMGMTVVLALATIAAWFPPRERGLPVGIFSLWFPVGTSAMLVLAPPIYESFGWRAVWLLGGAAGLVCLVGYALLVDLPQGREQREQRHVGASRPWHHGMLNPSAWLLALSFSCFQVSRIGFTTWAPYYLVRQAGFDLAAAAQVTSLNVVITIPATLATGWLLDRVASRRMVYSVAFLLLVPGWALPFLVDPAWIIPPMLVAGVLAGFVSTTINAAAPEVAREPGETGPSVGIVAIGRNAGMVAGPALLALVLQGGDDWLVVSLTLAGMSALGLVTGWLVRVK
ncbi:MAG: MFS transporter [Chloroflexi bacterium]|nr:MFS transporter [Chloroflexota bacterium]